MEPITILLGAMCCLGSLFVLIALVGVVIWRLQRSSTPPAGAVSAPPAPGAQSAVSGSAVPVTGGAERSVGALVDPKAGGDRGDAVLGGVEDFDEDGATIPVDTRSLETSVRLETASSPSPDQGQVQTERTFASRPPVPSEPVGLGAIPGSNGPPPLPAAHATDALPSARQLPRDGSETSEPGTLKPGATIIPPDDWNEDLIEEDELDQTMLMVRPPIPPED